MQTQVASISMGRGMDSKSDPKISARPTLLQNGIFTAPGQIAKRNGYDLKTNAIVGGGTWSNPTMAKSYRNELVIAAQNSSGDQRLYSFSPSLNGWSDQGKYWSVAVSKKLIGAPGSTEQTFSSGLLNGPQNSSCAVIGNIALFAYDIAPFWGNSSSASTYVNAVDLSTGTQLSIPSSANVSSQGLIANSRGYSKVAILGASTFAIFYITSTTSYNVAFRLVTVTAGGALSVGSESVITNALCQISGTGFPIYCYDVATTSAGCVLAVAQGALPGIALYLIDSSGRVGNPQTLSQSGSPCPISVNVDSSGDIWVYWVAGGTFIYYAVYNSSLGSILGKTEITYLSSGQVNQICGLSISSTLQTVYFSTYNFTQSDNYFISMIESQINSVTVYASGTVNSVGNFLFGADIYSKPVTVNGRAFLACFNPSSSQSTGFLVDVADQKAVAKFLQTSLDCLYSNIGGTSNSSIRTAFSGRYPGFLNSFQSLSPTVIGFAAGFVVNLSTEAYTSELAGTTNGVVSPNTVLAGAATGYAWVQFDFGNIDSFQGVIQQDTLCLNGGIVHQYDSNSVVELGFNVDPEFMTANCVTNAGSIPAGNYTYWYTFQWVDALGNIHESAPSPPITVYLNGSGSGNTNSVNLYCRTLTMTTKQNVQLNLYRTAISNGTIGYLVATAANNTGVNVIKFTDSGFNGISLNPTLYTQGGAIVDNIAPPPAMILWTNNNRLYCVDSENPETTIEYSKTASAGTGISFSTGLLELVIDSKGGAITGASPMDEKTVLLKANGLGFFTGDGADDSGENFSITNFQFIPTDTGCSNSKSVCLYPNGILFRSQNGKGIYQLSRGLQVSYFGADVEAYNSQDIQSAVIISNRNQIRFLTSSGSSLLYDYVMNQWSVFTNHAGLSADTWNGSYVYARSGNNAQDNNALFIEDASSFLDNSTAFQLVVKLNWLKASIPQGYQRLTRVILLGDYANGSSAGHGVQIQAAYDFGSSFQAAIGYAFGAASSSGVFQYRESLPQQLCDAIQLLITEVTTGASGEYVDLTDLGMEIGVHRGLNRLPALQSV